MYSTTKLYQLKGYTHRRFDRLWKEGYMTRESAYYWLSRELKIPLSECHIKEFDEVLCRKAIAAANLKVRKYAKKKSSKM